MNEISYTSAGSSVEGQLAEVKKDFVDALWFGLVVTVCVALPVSLFRIKTTGWLPIYAFHIAVTAIVLIGHLYRNKLATMLRGNIILLLMLTLGFSGFAAFGFTASHLAWLVAGGTYSGLIYSVRIAKYFYIGCIAGLLIFAHLFVSGILKVNVDLNQYVASPAAWTMLIVSFGLFAFAGWRAVGTLNQSIVRLAQLVSSQNRELERLATHDGLTGLPSVQMAMDRLFMAIASAKREDKKVALLFIDLDGFKAVNDTHGHQAGDAVLCEVAKRLSSSVRAEDTVSRIGGDEFVLVIVNLNSPDFAGVIAEKIIMAIAQPIEYEGASLYVGASIGIGIYPDDTTDPKLLKIRADEAMYRVKKSGKNGFAFASNSSGTAG